MTSAMLLPDQPHPAMGGAGLFISHLAFLGWTIYKQRPEVSYGHMRMNMIKNICKWCRDRWALLTAEPEGVLTIIDRDLDRVRIELYSSDALFEDMNLGERGISVYCSQPLIGFEHMRMYLTPLFWNYFTSDEQSAVLTYIWYLICHFPISSETDLRYAADDWIVDKCGTECWIKTLRKLEKLDHREGTIPYIISVPDSPEILDYPTRITRLDVGRSSNDAGFDPKTAEIKLTRCYPE